MSGYALVFSGPARLAQLLPQELPIASFPFSLGRGAAADGCVHATPQLLGLGTQSDAIISRAHAVLEMTPTGVCVRDLGSVNGTWVLLSSLDRQDCGSDRVRAGSGPGRKIRLAKDGGACFAEYVSFHLPTYIIYKRIIRRSRYRQRLSG